MNLPFKAQESRSRVAVMEANKRLEQLIQYKKKVPEVEIKKQGGLELRAGPSDISNDEARQGITLPPPMRSLPRFSTIHSDLFVKPA